MTLSIVIPVYNEEKTLFKILNRVYAVELEGMDKEIIVVDDGSNLETKQEILKIKKKYRGIKLLANERNRGKGDSLKKGFLASTGEIVLVQDADLEYSPKDYPGLIRPIKDNLADVVIGSRFINKGPHRVLYFHHFLANKFLTFMSNLLNNLNLSDMECGYKAFRGQVIRKIAKKLSASRFGFEPEIVARVAKEKLRVYEVGVSYYGRTYEEGKKIGWIDGVKAIFEIIYYNLFD